MAVHSKTVRGTFSNPKTKTTLKMGRNPTQLGDPISLESEKNDSVPLDSIPDFSKLQPADPYRQNEGLGGRLPYSKTFQDMKGGSSGLVINRSILGDPISMKAETSKSEWGRGAGPSQDEEQLRIAAQRRGEYDGRRRGSKL